MDETTDGRTDGRPPDPAAPPFGARLRERRWRELRVFQEALAAAVGLSPAQVCEIERGTAGTTPATLRKLAAALGLDFAALAAQAAREGRLAPRRAPPPAAGQAPPLPRLPAPPPRAAPATPWLTTAEAAALLGCTPGAVAELIRRGKLRPAIREPKSRRGQRRWLVAAAAVAGYDPPIAGWRRRPDPAPPGHLSVAEFARAVGVPTATLYRRVAAWGLATVKAGGRRWFPEDQLAAFRGRQAEEDAA